MPDIGRPRTAPQELALPVPPYVKVLGVGLGLGTAVLGLVYLLWPPYRPPGIAELSVVATIEPALGWVMVMLGTWVVAATLVGHGRASAHAVAAAAHGVYMLALVWSLFLTGPIVPSVAATLSWFALIAHAGWSLDYWQRGYR